MKFDINVMRERLETFYGQCWSHKEKHLLAEWQEMGNSSGHMTLGFYPADGGMAYELLEIFSDKNIQTKEFIASFSKIAESMPPANKFRVKFFNHKSEDFSVLGYINEDGNFELIDDGNFMRMFSLRELDPFEYADHCATQMVICRSSPAKWDALLILSERGDGKWNVGLHHFMTASGDMTRAEFVAATREKLGQTELGNISRFGGPGLVDLDLTLAIEELEVGDDD